MPVDDSMVGSNNPGERVFPNRGAVERADNAYYLDLGKLDAILVDLDGVITETATTHAEAWKSTFDEYLRARVRRLDGTFRPFDLDRDYDRYVDGKPRYKGVADFLQSRDIYLPPGEETDSPDKETVCGLGNRKNQHFLKEIRRHGVQLYQTSVDFIRRIKSHSVRVAVVSSSRSCGEILEATGISELFDVQVDGLVGRDLLLAGKPAPDTYLEAARRLGVDPRRACIIDDAISGAQAGKAGGFGFVIGVDRRGQPERLKQNGADIVVSDLGELTVAKSYLRSATAVPLALEKLVDIRNRVQNRRVVLFLDYDGTLTPIAERPELAVMSDDMRERLRAVACCCPVVVISGRKRSDVQRLVGLDSLFYAGSHGFDIAGPQEMGIYYEVGTTYVPVIAQAGQELRRQLASIEGAIVEDKTYTVAVHYRVVKPDDLGRVAQIVDNVLTDHPLLRKTEGKKVFELRPNIGWHKGKAMQWLLDALGLDPADLVPFYLGDDATDEDAFEVLHGMGIGILVADKPRPTRADYRLADPAEVGIFLNELTEILRECER